MTKNILAFLIMIIALTGCEQPKSPNFKLVHKFDVALSKQKAYPFLGADAAFIDTTAEGLEGICANGKYRSSQLSKYTNHNSKSVNKEVQQNDTSATSLKSKNCEINLSDLDFSEINVQFRDTLKADLSDLPSKENKSTLKKAILTLNYINGLPLDLEINLKFLNKNKNKIVYRSDLKVRNGEIGDDGFVEPSGKNESKTEISLTEKELRQLYKTRYLVIKTTTKTPGEKAVRIRGKDSIVISLDINADIRSTIN